MARRPDDTKGSLIFQEGKNIAGDFYIIAVYDDPGSCTIAFCAYELETDCTYTYPLTYSEFDSKFRFNSELMNPSNQDGRFHWVIERLDFVLDARGQKVLCLAHEPTPDHDGDGDEEALQPKKQGVAPVAAGGGKVDAVTRAKLLKELDTHDDEKLHRMLVKSEGARKRFLAELFAKRQLEQLKAQQRLQKTDEEREARLAKLDIIRQQQQQKAMQHKQNEEARKSVMAQLEVLMKQKEAQAIRRLIQEKDEQDRGMGRERDAARQRRKMQEHSAKEIAAIEKQRKAQLARKREDRIAKLDARLRQRDRQEAERMREMKAQEREDQARRRHEKDLIVQNIWAKKHEELMEKERRRREFERLEHLRDQMNASRDTRRAQEERAAWAEMREKEAEAKAAIEQRRRNIRKEYLLAWKVDSTKRAVLARENQKRAALREKKLQEKEDMRVRKLRETFRDTHFGAIRGRSPSPKTTANQDTMFQAMRSASPKAKDYTGGSTSPGHSSSPTRRTPKAEQSKPPKEKVVGHSVIIAQKLEVKERARLERELVEEQAKREVAERIHKRMQTFETLEQRRREAETEREHRRNEAVVQRARNLPIGTALPLALVF